MFKRTALSTAVVVAMGLSSTANTAFAEEVEKLDKIQVTGSRIARVDVEGPSPVIVISSEDIEVRGFTDVFEALNSLNQNTGGVQNQQDSFSFTPTAQAINLRGLGVGRSLILLDGKRLPMFPLGANGDTNFVDVGQIPIAAVERIEVLTDAASAVYGSDAMSGVVNIILKKDYEGVSLKARVGDSAGGGYGNHRLEFLGGTSTENARATFVAQVQNNEILRNQDRDWSNADNSTRSQFSAYSSYGATFNAADGRKITPDDCQAVVGEYGIDRTDGRCGFNRSGYRTLKPENESFDLMSNIEFDLSENMSAFTRLRYGRKETIAYFEPNPYKVDLVATDPGNPTFGTADAVDGSFTRRMVEFGPRQSSADTQYLGGLAGLSGSLMDAYDWEVSVGYTKQHLKESSPEIIQEVMDDMVKSGEVDLLQTIPQSVIDAARGESSTDAKSSIVSWSASLSGDVFELPAGAVSVASYAELNRSWYKDQRDQGTLDGIYSGKGGTSGGGSRTQTGLGAEVLVPVLENLELNLAARYDNYDDDSETGSATTPKVSFAYRPIDSLLVRGSWGKSFRAPDMQRLFGGGTNAFNSSLDPSYCAENKGTAKEEDACGTQYFDVTTGANKELKEETATNYAFGAVFEVVEDLSVSVDWFKTDLKDLVTDPELGRVIANPSRYAGAEVIREETTDGSLGAIDKVIYGPVNQAGETVEGVDVSIRYSFPETSVGSFTAALSTSHILTGESQTSANDPVKDYTEYMPKLQATLNLGWSYEKVSTNVFVKYRSSYCSEFANDYYFTDCAEAKADGYETKVGSMTTVNLSGKYRFSDNASVGFGITNLFDKTPPADPLSDFAPFYAVSYDNPVGRAFYLEAGYEF